MRSIRFAFTALPLLLLSAVATSGCAGCDAPPGDPDGGAGSLPPIHGGSGTDAGSDPGDGGSVTPPVDEKRVLEYTGQAPVELFYGESATLPFRLRTADGDAVTSELVRFSSTGTAGQLNVLEAVTDASGTARVTFTAGTTEGDVVVTAEADDVQAAVSVDVQVRVNPYGSLQVTVTPSGGIPLARAEMLVWRGAAGSVPTCAALATATTLPTATFAADFSAVPSQRSFTQQPQGTVVTARAVGFTAAGVIVAQGCIEGAAIVGGQTTSIAIPLAQLPSRLEGSYDVRMQIDVGNAIPEPYETYVNSVSAALADPAGYAAYHTLKLSDEQSGTWFLSWDVDGDGIDELAPYDYVAAHPEVFNTWTLVRGTVDQRLVDRFGEDYATLTTVGGDLRQTLTAFEVGSRFTLAPVSGVDGAYRVEEKWNDAVFTWRLGCAEGDLGCARHLVALENTSYAPVTTEYGATSALAPTMTESQRFGIATEPHLFSLRYGAIVVVAMNEVVFPNLPPRFAGNSLAEVFANIIDCAEVGADAAASAGIGSPQTYESFCTAGLNYAANYVEQRALELQVGAGDPQLGAKEQQGALGGGVFYLVDGDHDLVTETVDALSLQVQWNDPANGGASQDISAPITGEGRRAADGCTSDAACAAGTFCAPIAHYLKVQAVEMTCRRPIGDGLGEEACAADTECATGLCVGASQGVMGTCFSACSSDDACGLGTCVADAASVSLEDVLLGLGQASASSCVVPN